MGGPFLALAMFALLLPGAPSFLIEPPTFVFEDYSVDTGLAQMEGDYLTLVVGGKEMVRIVNDEIVWVADEIREFCRPPNWLLYPLAVIGGLALITLGALVLVEVW